MPGSSLDLPEDAPVGASILQVTAADADEGTNADIQYRLERAESTGGDGSGMLPFEVDPESGVIRIREVLDYESQRQYSLTVQAIDRGVPALSGRAEALIHLLDVNDNEPRVKFRYFPATSRFASVDENAAPGTVVALLTVSDADSPAANGNISVSILGGNEQRHFEVQSSKVPNLSLIKVAAALDRERIPTYNLTVAVTDNFGRATPAPVSRSSVASLVIFVNDINDHPPVFGQSVYQVNISEEVPPGSYVQGLSATDHDSGISGQDMAASGGLDREIVSQVVLNISARDQGVQPKISFAKLVVNILDVNDEKPQFSKPDGYHVSIAENTSPGTELLVLTAVDGDLGDNGTVTFILQESEIGGNSGGFPIVSWGAFRLDPVSGKLSTISQLDREEQEHYSLHVVATDLGNPPLSSVALVNVSLLDVNDNSPLFYPIQYFAHIHENEPAGSYIVTVSASDPDLGLNGRVRYSISAGDTSRFQIHSQTGVITTKTTLDREEKTAYQLQVVASDVIAVDQGLPKPLRDQAIVQVYMKDINDNAPKFLKELYQATISELAPNLTQVLRVSASDVDEGNNGLIHYSIIGGNEENQFAIDTGTGQVTLIGKLDHEATAFYSLTIQAVDSGTDPLSSLSMLNINVLDENDNSPSFPKTVLFVDILENMRIGELVTSATATDSDSGDNADLNYSITGTNNHGTFSISPNTASIFLSKKLDFETQSLYKLNITAKDKGRPPRSSTMSVVIYVRDYNDNPPVFPAGDIFKSIVENIPIGTSVISVEAHDPDADINGQLAYTIIQQMPRGNHFHIDEVKGTIYTSAEIDREFANLFELTVKAMDQAVPIESRRFALKNVTVLITDQNDNVPTFVSPNALAVEPSVVIGTVLTTIVAADPDEGANGEVEYEIINGVTDIFILDRYSGELRVSSALVLSQLMYSFIISATDLGPERRKSTTEMTVILQGLDGPIFTHPKYITILKEGEPIGTNVISIEAASPRGPEILVEYFIVSVRCEDKKFGRLFTIGRHTGVIQTAAVLDREQGARLYLVDVYAIEKSAASPRTQKAEVKIFAYFIIFLSCPCPLSPYSF
uniref:FAT atypical cadherin 4 n=1 Tax=Naja naja TaxID=35670 RepID=A0A8C6VM71_NAJNA